MREQVFSNRSLFQEYLEDTKMQSFLFNTYIYILIIWGYKQPRKEASSKAMNPWTLRELLLSKWTHDPVQWHVLAFSTWQKSQVQSPPQHCQVPLVHQRMAKGTLQNWNSAIRRLDRGHGAEQGTALQPWDMAFPAAASCLFAEGTYKQCVVFSSAPKTLLLLLRWAAKLF